MRTCLGGTRVSVASRPASPSSRRRTATTAATANRTAAAAATSRSSSTDRSCHAESRTTRLCAWRPCVPRPLRLGARVFAETDLVVMAIVNRTPDSFYDRGATFADEAALARVDAAVSDGAGIVDIGGVKAGPGAEVDAAEEIRRTAAFIEAVRSRHPDVVISIDTWRADVARAAVAAGADL